MRNTDFPRRHATNLTTGIQLETELAKRAPPSRRARFPLTTRCDTAQRPGFIAPLRFGNVPGGSAQAWVANGSHSKVVRCGAEEKGGTGRVGPEASSNAGRLTRK